MIFAVVRGLTNQLSHLLFYQSWLTCKHRFFLISVCQRCSYLRSEQYNMFSIGKDAACSHSIDHSQENIPIKKKRQNQGENKKTRKKKKKKAPRTESNSFLHQRPPCRSHLRLVSLCASSGSSRSLFPQRFISATERMCAHEKFGFRRETSSSRLLRGMLTWTGMSQKGGGEEGRGLGVIFF